mgnify:CR=1 FL=1
MRHLHDKVKVLDERTAPPKESETNDADAVAAQILTGGGMGDTLMLGDGNGYGAYPVPGGYPGNGGIPDPYAQPQGYNMGGNMGGGMEMNMGGGNPNMGNNMDMSGFNNNGGGGGAW